MKFKNLPKRRKLSFDEWWKEYKPNWKIRAIPSSMNQLKNGDPLLDSQKYCICCKNSFLPSHTRQIYCVNCQGKNDYRKEKGIKG